MTIVRFPRRAFVLQLQAEPGVDEIKAIRALLKTALRRFGLRAIDVRECALTHVEDERALAPTMENSMSAFSDRIRSQTKGFYKVADFEGDHEVTHTISYLDEAVEMFGKTLDILNFSDTGKQLNVNQTNAEWLLNKLGNNPEQWVGKKVTLYLAEYEYGDKKGQTIRLKLPGDATKPAAKEGTIIPPARGDGAANAPARSSSPQLDRETDLDDTIPF